MRIKIAIAVLLLACSAAWAQFSKSTISGQVTTQFPDNTTGQITPATTRTFLNNLLNSYQQYAGLNKQVGATYTVQASDYGQIITFNNGGAVAVTLTPANSSGFTTFNFYAQNITTGNVVITPTAGTICGASTMTLTNTQSAWIISDGTNWQCQYGNAGAPTGTDGATIPLNNGGFTQSNTANFSSTFKINGNTITWPAAAISVARIDAGQTFVGNNNFNGDVLVSGGMVRSTFGAMTIGNATCGAGNNGTVTGTNQVGIIGIGTAATTTCAVSFSNTLANLPQSCVLFPASISAADTNVTRARVSAVNLTGFNLVGSALAGANYYYHCE